MPEIGKPRKTAIKNLRIHLNTCRFSPKQSNVGVGGYSPSWRASKSYSLCKKKQIVAQMMTWLLALTVG